MSNRLDLMAKTIEKKINRDDTKGENVAARSTILFRMSLCLFTTEFIRHLLSRR